MIHLINSSNEIFFTMIPIFTDHLTLLNHFKIENKYVLDPSILGQGTYGNVYDYGLYAFKQYKKGQPFLNEMAIYQYIRKTDIAPEIHAFLISEQCNGILMQKGIQIKWLSIRVKKPAFIKIYKHLAKGLFRHLYSMDILRICHRDLKPDNLILTFKDNREWTEDEIKDLISDDSIAEYICNNTNLKIIDWGAGMYQYRDHIWCFEDTCTIWYACPEYLLEQYYHPTDLDIWSVGVTLMNLWEDYNYHVLFKSNAGEFKHQLQDLIKLFGTYHYFNQEIEEKIKKEDLDYYKYKHHLVHTFGYISPKKYSSLNWMTCPDLADLVNLLDQILVVDYKQRIKPKDIYLHRFVQGLDANDANDANDLYQELNFTEILALKEDLLTFNISNRCGLEPEISTVLKYLTEKHDFKISLFDQLLKMHIRIHEYYKPYIIHFTYLLIYTINQKISFTDQELPVLCVASIYIANSLLSEYAMDSKYYKINGTIYPMNVIYPIISQIYQHVDLYNLIKHDRLKVFFNSKDWTLTGNLLIGLEIHTNYIYHTNVCQYIQQLTEFLERDGTNVFSQEFSDYKFSIGSPSDLLTIFHKLDNTSYYKRMHESIFKNGLFKAIKQVITDKPTIMDRQIEQSSVNTLTIHTKLENDMVQINESIT